MEGQKKEERKKERKKGDNIRGRGKEKLVLARDMQRGNKRWLYKRYKGGHNPALFHSYQSWKTGGGSQVRPESWPIAIEIRQKEVENRLANREALIQPRFPAKRQSGTNPRSLRGVPPSLRPQPPGPLSGIPLSIGIYPLNSHLSKPNAGHFRPSDCVSSSTSVKFL